MFILFADCSDREESDLLREWFDLMRERTELRRYEKELLVRAQEVQLEDRHERLQQELRERLADDGMIVILILDNLNYKRKIEFNGKIVKNYRREENKRRRKEGRRNSNRDVRNRSKARLADSPVRGRASKVA